MPTITPPLPPQPPTSTPVPAPVLTVPHPPVELARLTIGGLLEASVVSQVGKEAYLLQTPIGQLSVLSGIVLPKDAALVLQILSFSPQALLQINSIDGALPAVALRAAPIVGQPPSDKNLIDRNGLPSGANKAVTLPPLLAGTVVKAVLVRPLAAPSANPIAQPAHVPGAAIGAPTPVNSPTPGLAAAPSGKGTIPPGATVTGAEPTQRTAGPGTRVPGASHPPATATGGGPARPTGASLPAGTQVGFKIASVQPPPPVTNNIMSPLSASGPALLATGRMLTGVITGTTAAGHPVVQTEAGVFSLNAQSSRPRGSIIALEVTTAPKPAAPAISPSAHPDGGNSNIFKDRQWPPLEEALQVLHEASPAASQHLLGAVLPRPDAQLTAGLVFFLSALRGGDLRPWLGDSNMRILEKSRPNLASRLSRDFKMLGKIADEPVGADWRVAMIPINIGTGIEQIRMLTRHHGNDEKDDPSADQGTRFILDVDLSRLGRLQLDGLVRDKGHKLDLIVRTGRPLDDQSRNDIRTIFTEAGDLTSVRGTVSFQASPPGFIEVPDPLADDTIGLIV